MTRNSAPMRESGDSTPALLLLLLKAVAARLPPGIIRYCMSACGLVALLSPLGMWVAWSKLMLAVVLLTGVAAIALFLALLWLYPGDEW